MRGGLSVQIVVKMRSLPAAKSQDNISLIFIFIKNYKLFFAMFLLWKFVKK